MIEKIDIAQEDQAKEVWDLQQRAYSVEAQWLGTREIPPLQETLLELQNCQEIFFAYYVEEKIVGILSYQKKNQVLDIHRLFVSPSSFKKGIGKALLYRLEEEEHQLITVMTGTKNEPAIYFYLKHGFEEVEKRVVSPTLSVTTFQKNVT